MITKLLGVLLLLIVAINGFIARRLFESPRLTRDREIRLTASEAMPCHEARNTPIVRVQTTECRVYEELEHNVSRCQTQYADFYCLNRN